MPVKLGSTIRGMKTDDATIIVVAVYKHAKNTMESMEELFETGLDSVRNMHNLFTCEFRETYIAKTPTGGDVHRCRFGEEPDVSFDRCRSCEIGRCPLVRKQQ